MSPGCGMSPEGMGPAVSSGRTAAARALGVNYRTMLNCYDSRQVSQRMRQALTEFRDSQDVGDDGAAVVGGEDTEATPGERAAALELENRELRETVEVQADELKALRRRVVELEVHGQLPGENDSVNGDPGQTWDWGPPRRGHGMPDAGVVTLEEQLDEAHAFGPAAPLVVEWRAIRAMVGDGSAGIRFDRAVAAVRRWELESVMLGEFHLTLPPETHPLDDARRADHVRRRRQALAEARRELAKAQRVRLLRRLLTLGMWRG